MAEIVVSFAGAPFEELAAAALRRAAGRIPADRSDWLELRLDGDHPPDPEQLAALCRAAPLPVAIACSSIEGDPNRRLQLLRAAASAGASAIEVDWREAAQLGELPPTCRRILSRTLSEVSSEDISAALAELEAASEGADLLQLGIHADWAEDALGALLPLEELGGRACLRASGRAGGIVSALAPVFGAPLVWLAGGDPSDPRRLRSRWPPGGASPSSAIYGVVGRPISGSLSPALQGAALEAAGIDALFLPFEPRDFGEFLRLASHPSFRGFSVTAPFKGEAFGAADRCDTESELARATNTLVREGEGWSCHNTDVIGVRRLLQETQLLGERGWRALILGAGGAARAAARAVLCLGGEASLVARDPERGRAAAALLGCGALSFEDLARTEYEVLINATPVGSPAQPGLSPVPREVLRPGTLVVDAVYGWDEPGTPLVQDAHDRGCHVVEGLSWFKAQGLEQFRLFTGREPRRGAMQLGLETAWRIAPTGEPRPVLALVGLRCSGKTSIGGHLAELLQRELVDLDERVAVQLGEPAAQPGHLLERRGEGPFRDAEHEALRASIRGAGPRVLATGGGCVEREDNRRLLMAGTRVIWLWAPIEILQERLRRDPSPRPALLGVDPVAELAELERRRHPLFAAIADLDLDTSRGSPAELAGELLARLRERGWI